MQISMDGLRKRLIADYNSLTNKLNNNIVDKSSDPTIVIDPNLITEEMERIRMGLVTLAFSYMEGEESFNAMDENTHFEVFFGNDDELEDDDDLEDK